MIQTDQKITFEQLEHQERKATLEALLFSSEEPLTTQDIFALLLIGNNNPEQKKALLESIIESSEITPYYIDQLINEINEELVSSGRPFKIVKVANGYVFATLSKYGEIIQRLVKSKVKKRLSQAALETLSIIAYRQPISKSEIEQIRGVSSNEVVNNLLERELISLAGRTNTPGKALLYTTSLEFLKTFGLNELSDLPKIQEIEDIRTDETPLFSRNVTPENVTETSNELQNDGEVLQNEEISQPLYE
ncbi:MAG: SMC-Scp complex subunit ScpB [Candidatus Kapabacteria bacterium]|nr:SMC-Scp complex subunit ScpB [Candidatus Kapabacteria bacterium]